MRQTLFTTVVMLLCMSHGVHAANERDQYLIFETSDSKIALTLESLKLTIVDGVLTATNVDGSRTFLLKDLTKLYFSEDDATKIANPQTDIIQPSDKVLFDIQGRRILHPSHGIYILKNSNKTEKVIVK